MLFRKQMLKTMFTWVVDTSWTTVWRQVLKQMFGLFRLGFVFALFWFENINRQMILIVDNVCVWNVVVENMCLDDLFWTQTLNKTKLETMFPRAALQHATNKGENTHFPKQLQKSFLSVRALSCLRFVFAWLKLRFRQFCPTVRWRPTSGAWHSQFARSAHLWWSQQAC